MYQAPGRTIGSRFASSYGFPQACSAGVPLQLHRHSTSLARPVGLMLAPRPDRLSAAISPENPIMKRTGQNGGHVSVAKEGPEAALDRRLLLLALQGVRSGISRSELPNDWSGIDGKIADTFNEIVQG